MIMWTSERLPAAALRLGTACLALAALSAVAVAQGTGSAGSGSAAGAATPQGNAASGASGQVRGQGASNFGKDGVAGTGLGGTASKLDSTPPGPTSGTGKSVTRPGAAGNQQP